jgi:hypothetical protein
MFGTILERNFQTHRRIESVYVYFLTFFYIAREVSGAGVAQSV